MYGIGLPQFVVPVSDYNFAIGASRLLGTPIYTGIEGDVCNTQFTFGKKTWTLKTNNNFPKLGNAILSTTRGVLDEGNPLFFDNKKYIGPEILQSEFLSLKEIVELDGLKYVKNIIVDIMDTNNIATIQADTDSITLKRGVVKIPPRLEKGVVITQEGKIRIYHTGLGAIVEHSWNMPLGDLMKLSPEDPQVCFDIAKYRLEHAI